MVVMNSQPPRSPFRASAEQRHESPRARLAQQDFNGLAAIRY